MKRLHIAEITGRPELMGVAAGKAAAPALIDAAHAATGAVVLLDFAGVRLITASAARESILRLSDELSAQGSLPVLVNINEDTADEVGFAAEALKQPLVLATLKPDGSLAAPRIVGLLEPAQRQTLELVARLGETDAKAASEASKDSSAGATAWNNRLSNLAGMRLLQERRVGKTKRYSLTLEGLAYGN